MRDWQVPDREDWIEALHHLVSTSIADRVVLIAHSLVGLVPFFHEVTGMSSAKKADQ